LYLKFGATVVADNLESIKSSRYIGRLVVCWSSRAIRPSHVYAETEVCPAPNNATAVFKFHSELWKKMFWIDKKLY